MAFTFYGDPNDTRSLRKGYLEGIRANLELMPLLYPDWTMRLYFDLNPDDPTFIGLCALACSTDILDLCHAGKLPGAPMVDATKVFPMIWRFFPTLDSQVKKLS